MVVCSALLLALVCGCGGETGSMMLKITDPPAGYTCKGNQVITCTMLNPAMAESVIFRAGGKIFATVTPANTMTPRMDTLSLNLPNGPVAVTVETTRNVYTTSHTLNVNNPRSVFVQDVSGNAGDYVTVRVKLNDFSTAANCSIMLGYDSSELLLDPHSVQAGGGIPDSSEVSVNAGMPEFLEVTITGPDTFTGNELMTASFQIRHTSHPGDVADIIMEHADLRDSAAVPIAVEKVDGSVTTN